MPAETQRSMRSPSLSLADLLGRDYVEAVIRARAFVTGGDPRPLRAVAEEKVDFAPPAWQRRLDELVDSIGKKVCDGFAGSAAGAGTRAFRDATRTAMSPLTGFGPIRIGEDGRAYLAAKSEHYHASLGHGFPGYALLEKARALGISNITHNNTRGHVTRLLEEELVRIANGLPRGDREGLRAGHRLREPARAQPGDQPGDRQPGRRGGAEDDAGPLLPPREEPPRTEVRRPDPRVPGDGGQRGGQGGQLSRHHPAHPGAARPVARAVRRLGEGGAVRRPAGGHQRPGRLPRRSRALRPRRAQGGRLLP